MDYQLRDGSAFAHVTIEPGVAHRAALEALQAGSRSGFNIGHVTIQIESPDETEYGRRKALQIASGRGAHHTTERDERANTGERTPKVAQRMIDTTQPARSAEDDCRIRERRLFRLPSFPVALLDRWDGQQHPHFLAGIVHRFTQWIAAYISLFIGELALYVVAVMWCNAGLAVRRASNGSPSP